MAVRKKYYVVWEGRDTGVFDSWEDAFDQINGFPGAKYKSFPNLEAAVEAFRGTPQEHIGVLKSIATHCKNLDFSSNPEIVSNALAVDAACSHNPGPVEYQGVDLSTGKTIFHVGPLEGGTNNIGEFLAIVHALALLHKHNLPDRTIYSDSRTAIAWVKHRHANTKITPTAENAKLMELVTRAEKWLATHTVVNPILKWDTEQWGEIPADFGRK